MAAGINPQKFSLPRELEDAAGAILDGWAANGKVSRLWARDASLWTGADEAKWLGWLSIVAEQEKNATRFAKFPEKDQDAAFSHALLLGMGGSNLFPQIFCK